MSNFEAFIHGLAVSIITIWFFIELTSITGLGNY